VKTWAKTTGLEKQASKKRSRRKLRVYLETLIKNKPYYDYILVDKNVAWKIMAVLKNG